jgi:ATP-dependent Zn protease
MPVMIFIDEIDAVGYKRTNAGGGMGGMGNRETETTLN